MNAPEAWVACTAMVCATLLIMFFYVQIKGG